MADAVGGAGSDAGIERDRYMVVTEDSGGTLFDWVRSFEQE